jgi:hypothetical protein
MIPVSGLNFCSIRVDGASCTQKSFYNIKIFKLIQCNPINISTFFIVVDIQSFKNYLLEHFSLLDLFGLHSICKASIMCVICAVRKDVDVFLLLVLSCAHHWL